MLKLTTEDLSRALAGLTTTDKAELLRLLSERERLQQDEAFEDPRSPMAEFLTEFGELPPPSTLRQVVRHDGERPSVEAFIREFAPVLPPAPPKAEPKATIASTPDIATRVPPGRRGKLLDDVLARTTEEMRRSTPQQSDDGQAGAVSRCGPTALGRWRLHRRLAAPLIAT